METDELRKLYKQLDETEKYKKDNKLLYLKPLSPKPPWPEYRLNKPQTDGMNCYTEDGLIPKRLIIKGANKTTKGQPIDEPILTPDGWLPIGKIKIGDLVASPNGNWTKVTKVINRGKRKVFMVELKDGGWTRCDEEHLWRVQYKRNHFRGLKKKTNNDLEKWKVISTRELIDYKSRVSIDGNHIVIPTTNPIEFNERNLLIDPYILGALLGGDHFGNKNHNSSVTITTKDREIVDSFIKTGHELKPIKSSKYGYTVYSNNTIDDKGRFSIGKLRKNLEHYGLYGLKSWEKFIPDEYLYGSVRQRINLVCGLMNTGSYVHRKKYSAVAYSTTSLKLAIQFVFLIQSLGGSAKIRAIIPKYTHKREISLLYRILFSINFCPFLAERKEKIFCLPTRTGNRVIKEIKEIGTEECVCIVVDNPDGLYITRDCIVTHNSHFGAIRGVCLALGEHPFLPDDHPLKYTNKQIPTPNVGLVAGEHLTQVVEKKLVPAYLEWIPKITGFSPRKHVKRNSQGVITKIEIPYDLHGNKLDSIIYFGHYLDHEAQEGIDFNWIHLDEPPPQKFYTAVVRGLVAYGGVLWMAFTSLKEPWVYDMIAERSVDYGGNDKTTRIVEFGDIWSNSIRNGGFLTDTNIEDFIADVPKEEYSTRILGEWMRGGERIFSSFMDEEPYVCPDYDIPKHWTWYEGADLHDGKDTIWGFLAVSPHEIDILGEVVNRIFLVDYLRLAPGMSISEMAKEIKIKRAQLGYTDPNSITIDGKHGKRRQAGVSYRDSVSWQEKLEDVDIGYIELADQKPGDVDIGHKIVREYLKPQYSKLFEVEIPGFVIMDRCRGAGGPIEALLKYRYKKDSNKPEDDEYKDICDAIRYPLMKMPTYIEKYQLDDYGSESIVSPYTGR